MPAWTPVADRGDGAAGDQGRLGRQPRVDRVECATVDAVPVQIDGEILHLEPASEIVIDSVPQALATFG